MTPRTPQRVHLQWHQVLFRDLLVANNMNADYYVLDEPKKQRMFRRCPLLSYESSFRTKEEGKNGIFELRFCGCILNTTLACADVSERHAHFRMVLTLLGNFLFFNALWRRMERLNHLTKPSVTMVALPCSMTHVTVLRCLPTSPF